MTPNEHEAIQALIGLGWSAMHACGAVANLEIESGLNPVARGDHGQAVGIAQWHPDRVAVIEHETGINVRSAGLGEQLRAFDWEMRHTQPEAMEATSRSTSAFAAGYNICQFYERPANVHAQATMRGNAAVQLYRDLGL